ncbi:hypothetical protein CR152_29445 [Massilia violaceinigra]|uniref:GSCFA domain-containing protein n=1 Tax=Massilia violaceinigra TaxID=2045208 RepID=A0A2D2DT74_9BURK|nr:GSCFA domain-containing protein [Massilia violaceinigra]ATQ78180.1 hypothetical protein CR152_29445 [Massilia violaceinigra]
MKNTPYQALPEHCFWQRAVAGVAREQVDALVTAPFMIAPGERIVTAGSCFAQHVGRHLRAAGLSVLQTEPAHDWLHDSEAASYGYGIYSARYGNIYTARQLLQLFQRAHGQFQPAERLWEHGARCIDPFRPRIQPDGFATREEFEADQRQHFGAVRSAFAQLDVLIFTLGLTQAWEALDDGAVFPLCPGVAGGSFDALRHRVHNFSVAEVTGDMLALIDLLRAVNPAARLILTVSPVPLAAGAAAHEHVLTANTWSKSVLRVACADIVARRERVAYMPSYELITGAHARGAYVADDLRSVTEAGVSHVMRVFLRHFIGSAGTVVAPGVAAAGGGLEQMAQLVAVNCDDDALKLAPAAPLLAPLCNLCGGEAFGPGPGGRLGKDQLGPHCLACGSLERQRVAAQVLLELGREQLAGRRALLVGAERGADVRWFRHCDAVQASAPGVLPAALADYADASYDLIVLVHVLEYLDDDRAGFDQLRRLLSPTGLLLACFVDPRVRPWTSLHVGPAGSARRWYGRDLAQHFRCKPEKLGVTMHEVADPGTGAVLPVHLFAAATSPKAPPPC